MKRKALIPCEYCGVLIHRFDVMHVSHNGKSGTNHYYHRSCYDKMKHGLRDAIDDIVADYNPE